MKPPDLEAQLRLWFPKAHILKQNNKKQSASYDALTIELNKLGMKYFLCQILIFYISRPNLHERF